MGYARKILAMRFKTNEQQPPFWLNVYHHSFITTHYERFVRHLAIMIKKARK